MNFPGVLSGDTGILSKINLARGKAVDGHAPGVSGKNLSAYIAVGIHSDHESTSLEEAREKIATLDSAPAKDAESLKKRAFYKAVEIVCEAVINFAQRYRQEALRMAGAEEDPVRKSELEEIARICEKVPAGPAESFREALQSIWFVEIALHQENYEQAIIELQNAEILFRQIDVKGHPFTIPLANGVSGLANTIVLIGLSYQKLGNYQKAVQYFESSFINSKFEKAHPFIKFAERVNENLLACYDKILSLNLFGKTEDILRYAPEMICACRKITLAIRVSSRAKV
jgi:tetratricopeptide (TPR) repeat protein